MVHARPGLTRLVVAAAAGVSCLAVAACGGLTAVSLRPMPASTVDPLARLPGSKIAAEAIADAKDAPSLTMSGSATDSGKSFTISLRFKHGLGCAGTVGYPGQGSVQLIVIGKSIYMKPDAKFWTVNAGAKAPLIITLLNGRYLEVSSSDKNMAQVAAVCDLATIFHSDPSLTYVKKPVTTFGGTRVLPLGLSDGSTEYVTDSGRPEFVKAFAPKDSKVGAGDVTVSVGAPVTLGAPPASQVINESQLGLSPAAQPTGPSLA